MMQKFFCPKCRTELKTFSENTSADGREGYRCPACAGEYPVVDNIPRFCAAENYADSFGFQWNRFARTQLDTHNGTTLSHNRVFASTGWPETLEGETLLEAGSGAGRFTEILLRSGAEIYSFDYSSAVSANAQNNGTAKNLHLFQGDIYALPFQPASFDKVFCLGVLQHTPDPKEAFMRLVSMLKEDGEIVVDVYRKSLRTLVHWKYLLRPVTKRMNKKFLFYLIRIITPLLLPPALLFQRIFGPLGGRFLPIAACRLPGLSYRDRLDWSILDTFDMYAPAYDAPQTIDEIKSWFNEAGLCAIDVGCGINGVLGRGKRRKTPCAELPVS